MFFSCAAQDVLLTLVGYSSVEQYRIGEDVSYCNQTPSAAQTQTLVTRTSWWGFWPFGNVVVRHSHGVIALMIWLLVPDSAMASPDSGGALQQLPPVLTSPVAQSRLAIERRTVDDADIPQAIGLQINLQELQFQGNTVFPETVLRALITYEKGVPVSLTQLRSMVQIITTYYQSRGYLAAQAFLPPQNISGGIVVIGVAEGRYGKILVQNQTQIANGVIADLMSDLASGDLVRASTLDLQLLQIGQLPGTQLKSRLIPGDLPGTTDLLLKISPTRRVQGVVDADNAGNEYTGTYRAGGTIYMHEPLGQGDSASLRLLTSLSGLNYLNANYQMMAGRASVGAGISSLSYALGREFKSLAASGNVWVAKLYGSYPLQLTADSRVTAELNVESKNFHDYVTSLGGISDKSSQLITGTLIRESHDHMGGAGINNASVGWSLGTMQYQSLAQWSLDSQTANINGPFSKLTFAMSRAQTLGAGFSVYAAVSGQVASKNLDTSEKMELGGMFGVRAYPEGEAYGDNAVMATLQAQWRLINLAPSTELIVFYDAGTVEINASPWLSDTNVRHLQASGIGLHWNTGKDYSLRIYAAHKLGNEPAQSAKDADNRVWVHVVRYFQ